MKKKRLAGFAAAIALLTGGLIGGIAAPASALTQVSTYAELVAAVAASGPGPGDTVQLTASITEDPSALAVDPGETVTIDVNGFTLSLTGRDDDPGIEVPPTSTLVLIDTAGGGVVRAVAVSPMFTGAAGIGTATGNAGTIVVDGPNVTASGVIGGAGIGGGTGGAATVEIRSGAVSASGGGSGGAAIGSGAGVGGSSITISGGTVTAVSFNEGAGIGGGENGDGGTIVISGGTVDARNLTTNPANSGAAIGGGALGAGGSITITGGIIDALGGFAGGAGIGGGATAFAGTIDLRGGVITASATDTYSAAIGTGGFYAGIPTPSATLAGSPTPGSATRAAEGLASRGTTYSPDGSPGVTYTATSTDPNGMGGATSTLSFAYAVTFDVDGGSPDPADQLVVWGAAATEPAAPTKTASIFDGWHVDTAGGALWDFADPVTEPLDLVAAWIELPAISGSPPDGAVGAAYNYAMTVSPAAATVAVQTGSLPPGLTVDAAGIISGVPTTIGSFTATLRASHLGYDDDVVVQIDVVAGAPQAVTFDPDGGTPDPPDQMIGIGATVVEPGDPAKPGFAFIEWRVGTTAGPAYDFSSPVSGPVSLVAAWGQQPTLTGPATATGSAGTPIATVQLVSGGPGVTVSDDGTLPSGLTFNAGTLQVTGMPNGLAGTYPVTFTAHNTYGDATHVVTFTIAHGVATSFSATASDVTPDQGDTITVTVTASDGYGNSWDASAAATITSDVPSDVVVGNTVTFPHASPHVLNIALPGLAAQQLLIQVQARLVLGLTGSDLVQVALPIGVIAILCGTSLMLLRRRRWA